MIRLALALIPLLAGPLRAQAVLEPPFGLTWGDTPEKLIDWAGRHSLDVRITLPGDSPGLRIVRVEAAGGLLPGSRAHAVEARFLEGRLFELAVHYGRGGEDPELVERRFTEMRRGLTAEHGKLALNQQDRSVADKFSTRTLSYHHEPVKGLFLMLALTEVEDLLRRSRRVTFSLVYRNDNLRGRLAAAAAAAGGGEAGSD